MTPLFSLILTTQHYLNHINAVKNTWGKHIDHIFYSDHEDLNNHIIKVSEDSTYHSNEEKQINVLNAVKNLYFNNQLILDSYKWILLADDDTFVNYKLVYEMLKSFDEDKVYGFILNRNTDVGNPIFNNHKIPEFFSYIAGGTGCFISAKTIKSMHEFKNYRLGYSDVSLGFNFLEKNIELKNIDNCCRWCNVKSYKNISDIYSFHYINETDMKFLYDLL